MKRKFHRLIAVAPILLALAACGGGGGGSSSAPPPPQPPPNASPEADAGEAFSVDAGAEVVLDGSGSTDSDGSINTYEWVQTDGPDVSLQNATTVQASFTAPTPTVDVELVFQLTVTDDDGATDSESVTVTVVAPEPTAFVNITGLVVPSASQSLDGDTNDPFNPLTPNDDQSNPQPLGNPTTLGGYVNEAGTGAEGRSQVDGDPEDFYQVELFAGQTLNLLTAEFREADADLYLLNQNGDTVDFSIETGELDSITVEEAGTYVVNVSIFRGATNYTLTIGSTLTPERKHYDEIIPDQVILAYDESQDATRLRERLRREVRLRHLGGGPRRSRLLAMERAGNDAQLLQRRLGAQRHRLQEFADPALARRWSTLLSIKSLAREPGVRSAEPNYRLHSLATVNDRNYEFQWHYPLINLPGAWDTTVGNAEVVVAVVDSGILSRHPDIIGQLEPGFDFIRNPEEAGDGDGIDANPEEERGSGLEATNFHGTHVAGTVAARGNNGIGVAGVAYGSRIMPLRALGPDGGTLYDVNQAIRFAVGLENDSGTVPERPARIVNLSIGGGGFSPSTQALFDELRALGIIVVAAAGNESSRAPSYPASYDNVISVSAVDAQQRITDYSNTGSTVDVAAPGGDGSVDLNGDGYPDGVLSTGASDGDFAYTFLSGTSMASPHVAGVLALMLSVNPELDGDDIDVLLEAGALTDDLGAIGRDNLYGHGLINARKAIETALAEIGESSNSQPRLASSTSGLNFGSQTRDLEVILRNSGGGELTDVTLATEQPWIRVTSINADSDGLGTYRIRVDRDELSPGIYEGQVTASSSANSIAIRVLITVSDSFDSDLGQIYLLLFDPAADQAVAQALPERSAAGYTFELRNVPTGSYQFYVGTDLDNDLLICDPGEACGSFLTIDDPLTIDIQEDRDDIIFPIEYFIALPEAADVTASDKPTRFGNLKRLLSP